MRSSLHRASRSNRLKNDINVVPYVDVMLVLLVIFMVTAPLLTPGEIRLPSVSQAQIASANPIRLYLSSDKRIALHYATQEKPENTIPLASTQNAAFSSDHLAVLIRAIQEIKRNQPETPVVLGADKDIRYEQVMQLMDALQKADVGKIGLMVSTETSPPVDSPIVSQPAKP